MFFPVKNLQCQDRAMTLNKRTIFCRTPETTRDDSRAEIQTIDVKSGAKIKEFLGNSSRLVSLEDYYFVSGGVNNKRLAVRVSHNIMYNVHCTSPMIVDFLSYSI